VTVSSIAGVPHAPSLPWCCLLLRVRVTARVRIRAWQCIACRRTLNAVNVSANKDCRVSPDTGPMVARVWDEARKAMLAS
jgi:hypothetical protein